MSDTPRLDCPDWVDPGRLDCPDCRCCTVRLCQAANAQDLPCNALVSRQATLLVEGVRHPIELERPPVAACPCSEGLDGGAMSDVDQLWAATLDPALRWRQVFTDSEALTGVAPVCTSPAHPADQPNDAMDCCPDAFEVFYVPLAARLVRLLNGEAAMAHLAAAARAWRPLHEGQCVEHRCGQKTCALVAAVDQLPVEETR